MVTWVTKVTMLTMVTWVIRADRVPIAKSLKLQLTRVGSRVVRFPNQLAFQVRQGPYLVQSKKKEKICNKIDIFPKK